MHLYSLWLAGGGGSVDNIFMSPSLWPLPCRAEACRILVARHRSAICVTRWLTNTNARKLIVESLASFFSALSFPFTEIARNTSLGHRWAIGPVASHGSCCHVLILGLGGAGEGFEKQRG